MAEFRMALPLILDAERGFVDNPADPGGATNWGISLRWLKTLGDLDGDGYQDGDLDRDGDVDAQDIRKMDPGTAGWFYENQWWTRYGYGRFTQQDVANKMILQAINMGPDATHRCLQRALLAISRPVEEDGKLGPATIQMVNSLGPHLVGALIASLRSECWGHYREIMAKNPKLETFRNGWRRRAYA